MHRIKMEPDLTTKKTFLLPATAERYLEGESSSPCCMEEGVFGWSNPKVQIILMGTRDGDDGDGDDDDDDDDDDDSGSPLALLRNFDTSLVRTIAQFLCNEWAKHIKFTIPAALIAGTREGGLVRYTYGRVRPNHRTRHSLPPALRPKSVGFDNGYVAFSKCGEVKFPEPTGRKVTMMPFVLGDRSSLPEDLKCYFDLVIEQCPYMKEEIGKVAYLTVQEIFLTKPGACSSNSIKTNELARGLRIEPPNMFKTESSSFRPGIEVPKSIELFIGPDRYEGGIYTACNRRSTLMFWDALIDKDKIPEDVVDGSSGDYEKLRGLLGDATSANEEELMWMTDCTPHEILPFHIEAGYYQYFRLVTPSILYWDADISTPNPKVPVPDDVSLVRSYRP
jgi:hypothetical protein